MAAIQPQHSAVDTRIGVAQQSGGRTRPIRICRVIARLNLGGAAAHVIQLTAGLDSQRFAQRIITGVEGPGEASMLPEARARGLDPVIIPELGRELRARSDLLTLVKLVRELRRWQPDIVETHTAKAGAVGRLAAVLSGIPVRVHVFHGHVFHGYFGPVTSRLFLELERALARVSTRIIALGDEQRRELLAYGIGTPDRVISVPLGFDLHPFRHAGQRCGLLRAELGLGPAGDTPLVGVIGRLVPIKAHEVFLEAAAIVHRELPHVHFAIAGDGERRAELEQRARTLGIAGQVHFLGWRPDPVPFFADVDVLALTSDNEGMPVSIIEAMAAGTPVVATDVGGVRSLVTDGETGLLAPRRDAGAVAAACLRLLRHPALRRQMGAAARAAAYPRYHLSTLLSTMTAFYEALIAERPRLRHLADSAQRD